MDRDVSLEVQIQTLRVQIQTLRVQIQTLRVQIQTKARPSTVGMSRATLIPLAARFALARLRA